MFLTNYQAYTLQLRRQRVKHVNEDRLLAQPEKDEHWPSGLTPFQITMIYSISSAASR